MGPKCSFLGGFRILHLGYTTRRFFFQGGDLNWHVEAIVFQEDFKACMGGMTLGELNANGKSIIDCMFAFDLTIAICALGK